MKDENPKEDLQTLYVRGFVRDRYSKIFLKYMGKPDQIDNLTKEVNEDLMMEFQKIAKDEIQRINNELM